MPIHSDFTIISFNEHLGDQEQDIRVPGVNTTFVGNQTSLKNFHLDGLPLPGMGYLLLTAYDVNNIGHRVIINGVDLLNFDIPPNPGRWQTWMDWIDIAFLRQGNNTIQIRRDTSTGDNFAIGVVVINWREIS